VGDFEKLGETLKRAAAGPDGPSSEATGEESRTCKSCGAEFNLRLVTRSLLGRAMVFGDRQECPSCRSAREDGETREAQVQARLARLGAQEDFRRRSGLPRRYWPETFARWEERGWPRSRAYLEARRWVEELPDNPAGYRSLILYSRLPGVGKTTLAACVVNALIGRWEGGAERAVLPVRYETGPSLNIRVRATYDVRPDQAPWRETEAEMYRSLRGVRLLVLDDVGDPDKEPPSDHTRRLYFHVVDQRYGDGLPVLLVTNSQGRELEQVMGRYTVDRLYEMAEGKTFTLLGKTRKQRFEVAAGG